MWNGDNALAWAVLAKLALQNYAGYSPNQLVFGTNGILPSVITDLARALESFTSSDIVRRYWYCYARKNFLKAESVRRIKRALRHKVRTYCEENFQNGDKVFYKRRAVKGWKDLATVVGKEANCVLIRHGSAFYRCHPSHPIRLHNRNLQQLLMSSQSIKTIDVFQVNSFMTEAVII